MQLRSPFFDTSLLRWVELWNRIFPTVAGVNVGIDFGGWPCSVSYRPSSVYAFTFTKDALLIPGNKPTLCPTREKPADSINSTVFRLQHI